jgi:hypothetical protein
MLPFLIAHAHISPHFTAFKSESFPLLVAMSVPTEADINYMLAHTDDDRRSNYIAANAICVSVAITAVILRFISRTIAGVKIGIDDYTILVSLVTHTFNIEWYCTDS